MKWICWKEIVLESVKSLLRFRHRTRFLTPTLKYFIILPITLMYINYSTYFWNIMCSLGWLVKWWDLANFITFRIESPLFVTLVSLHFTPEKMKFRFTPVENQLIEPVKYWMRNSSRRRRCRVSHMGAYYRISLHSTIVLSTHTHRQCCNVKKFLNVRKNLLFLLW